MIAIMPCLSTIITPPLTPPRQGEGDLRGKWGAGIRNHAAPAQAGIQSALRLPQRR